MASWKDYLNAGLHNPAALTGELGEMYGFDLGDSYNNVIDLAMGAGYNNANFMGYSDNPYADALLSGLYDDFTPNWKTAKRGRAFVDSMLELQTQYGLMDYQNMNQMQLMAYQDSLTNPVRQAQLMRQAGINPDLAGLSGSSVSGGSAASGTAPKINSEGGSPLGDIGEVFSLASTFMGGIGGLFNNIASFSELMSRIPVNQAKAGLTVAQMTNEQLKSIGLDIKNRIDEFGLHSSLGSLARTLAPYINSGQTLDLSLLGLPDDQLKVLQSYMDVFKKSDIVEAERSDARTKIDSDTTQRSTNEATRIANEVAIAQMQSDPLYDTNRSVMIELMRPVRDMYYFLHTQDLELQKSVNKFMQTYYRLRRPADMADAENMRDYVTSQVYASDLMNSNPQLDSEARAAADQLSISLNKVLYSIEQKRNSMIMDLWDKMNFDNMDKIMPLIQQLTTQEFGERKINYILRSVSQGVEPAAHMLSSIAWGFGSGMFGGKQPRSAPAPRTVSPATVRPDGALFNGYDDYPMILQ